MRRITFQRGCAWASGAAHGSESSSLPSRHRTRKLFPLQWHSDAPAPHPPLTGLLLGQLLCQRVPGTQGSSGCLVLSLLVVPPNLTYSLHRKQGPPSLAYRSSIQLAGDATPLPIKAPASQSKVPTPQTCPLGHSPDHPRFAPSLHPHPDPGT